jgi:hypothetical protein
VGASTAKWGVAVVLLAASGWAGFTVYERVTKDRATVVQPEAGNDSSVDALVTEAYQALAVDKLDEAAQKLEKAAATAPADARVEEGLVLVAVRRCERTYLSLTLGEHADGKRRELAEQLDEEVHRAREIIAQARRTVRDASALERIKLHEREINTELVLAFVRAGDLDRARGALSARLSDHPQADLLKAYVGAAPVASASASASASATPSAAVPATARPPAVPYSPHYELLDEPNMSDHHTPGELVIPPPDPAPAPAPQE